MGNETRVDKMVEAADLVYGIAVDRTVERMNQVSDDMEKDKSVMKGVVKAKVETAEIVIEAAAEHYAGLLNGEGIDLKKEKDRAIETIDKMVGKADEYYGKVIDRIAERIKEDEENLEKDIETGKKLVNTLKSNR